MALYHAARHEINAHKRSASSGPQHLKTKKRVKVQLHSRRSSTSIFFKKFTSSSPMSPRSRKKTRKQSNHASKMASEAEKKWLHMTPRSRTQSRARITKVLTDKTLSTYFHEFLRESLCAENFLFWRAVELYKTIDDAGERIKAAEELFDEYIVPESPNMINLPGCMVSAVQLQIVSGKVNCFAEPQETIFQLMQEDSYPKFYKSVQFQEYSKTVKK
eukprot:TRINITY_DN3745_c1_g1_i1.p1 TRINITY_DN3745_c1_g1~~TRINITY_DN3745_c1_g1_i1.p1  ORF type:complete len:217 (-),score=27.66 TRINITY_DN3745_c1_g1_i1:111-761(-)